MLATLTIYICIFDLVPIHKAWTYYAQNILLKTIHHKLPLSHKNLHSSQPTNNLDTYSNKLRKPITPHIICYHIHTLTKTRTIRSATQTKTTRHTKTYTSCKAKPNHEHHIANPQELSKTPSHHNTYHTTFKIKYIKIKRLPSHPNYHLGTTIQIPATQVHLTHFSHNTISTHKTNKCQCVPTRYPLPTITKQYTHPNNSHTKPEAKTLEPTTRSQPSLKTSKKYQTPTLHTPHARITHIIAPTKISKTTCTTYTNHYIMHYEFHSKTLVTQYTFHHKLLLLRGGDIETNPGPPSNLNILTKKFPKHMKKRYRTYFQNNTISLRIQYEHLNTIFNSFSNATTTTLQLKYPHLVDFYSTCSQFPLPHILFALICTIAPTPQLCNYYLKTDTQGEVINLLIDIDNITLTPQQYRAPPTHYIHSTNG